MPLDVHPGWSAVLVTGVTRSAKQSKGQKQFDKLLTRLRSQRKEIARWEAFKRVYQERLSGEYQPLAKRLRGKRIDTAKLLDHALERKVLKKRERDKVWETLSGLLLALLAEEEDAELIQLHDKYADVGFADQRQRKMDLLRTSAGEAFGIDAAAYGGNAHSPEELADWIADQVRAATTPVEPAPGEGAKATAREVREERVIEGGARSMRAIFRKLVSELHPDRETDLKEHARKTQLMQKVNKAYKNGDLFTLLEMQRGIEHGAAAGPAGVTDERFRHYNHVLEKQSVRLRQELAALMAPFEMVVGEAVSRKITPDDVRRALDADIIDLKSVLRTVELDFVQFQGVLQLKPALKNRPFDPTDGEPWVMPNEPRRGYRGRHR